MALDVFLAAAATALGIMLVFWLVSLALKDASIADIAWGLVFVGIAWASWLAGVVRLLPPAAWTASAWTPRPA